MSYLAAIWNFDGNPVDAISAAQNNMCVGSRIKMSYEKPRFFVLASPPIAIHSAGQGDGGFGCGCKNSVLYETCTGDGQGDIAALTSSVSAAYEVDE